MIKLINLIWCIHGGSCQFKEMRRKRGKSLTATDILTSKNVDNLKNILNEFKDDSEAEVRLIWHYFPYRGQDSHTINMSWKSYIDIAKKMQALKKISSLDQTLKTACHTIVLPLKDLRFIASCLKI